MHAVLQTYRKMVLVFGWGLGGHEAATAALACTTSGNGSTHTIDPMESSVGSQLLCLGNQTSKLSILLHYSTIIANFKDCSTSSYFSPEECLYLTYNYQADEEG